MSDQEVLDVGGDRRPGMSWRLRLSLLVSLLVVAAAVLLADRQLRRDEEAALDRCAEEVTQAVDQAGRRVRAAYEYVRPSLTNPTPELQETARRVLSKAARGADDTLAAPRETCTGISVLPLHASLQERREHCLRVLEAHRAGLVAVADDGGNFSEWSRLPRTCAVVSAEPG